DGVEQRGVGPVEPDQGPAERMRERLLLARAGHPRPGRDDAAGPDLDELVADRCAGLRIGLGRRHQHAAHRRPDAEDLALAQRAEEARQHRADRAAIGILENVRRREHAFHFGDRTLHAGSPGSEALQRSPRSRISSAAARTCSTTARSARSPADHPTSDENQTCISVWAIADSRALPRSTSIADSRSGATPRSADEIRREMRSWKAAILTAVSWSPVAMARTSARANCGRRASARVARRKNSPARA